MKNSLPSTGYIFIPEYGKSDLLLEEMKLIIVSLFGGAKVSIIC